MPIASRDRRSRRTRPTSATRTRTGVGSNAHEIARAALSELVSENGLDLNDVGQFVVRSIAFAESGYGMSGGGFESFNGSNNWGARQGSGDCGSILHGDTDEYGKPYETNFAKYCTPKAGANGFFHTRAWGTEPYKSAVFAAANRGDVFGVAKAMHEGGYFGGFPEKGLPPGEAAKKVGTPEDNHRRQVEYAQMIMNNAKWVSKGTGESMSALYLDDSPSRFGVGTVVLVATLVGAVYLAFTHAGRAVATGMLLSSRRLFASLP